MGANGTAGDHPAWLPGDPRPNMARMVRVDQAGEYGAARIYAGQLAAIGGRHPHAHLIARMAGQEARHLDVFDRMLSERRVRPTLLGPLWTIAGWALGAATALGGPRAAMAATAAVETEIDAHYGAQLEQLGERDPELAANIADFRGDEADHRETALANDAEAMPGYGLFAALVRAGCRAAIMISERI